MGPLRKARLNRIANRMLNRLQREGKLDPKRKEAVAFILKNGKARDDFEDDLRGYLMANADEVGVEDEEADDPEFPLLRFLWDHRDEILAFILKIVGLFRKPD
jgi:hypothetical protein